MLLEDIRLYDEVGRPLTIGVANQDPNRRTVRTRSGGIALNAFPIRYYEPGTRRVAEPTAGVEVSPAPLATKPLFEKRPKRDSNTRRTP